MVMKNKSLCFLFLFVSSFLCVNIFGEFNTLIVIGENPTTKQLSILLNSGDFKTYDVFGSDNLSSPSAVETYLNRVTGSSFKVRALYTYTVNAINVCIALVQYIRGSDLFKKYESTFNKKEDFYWLPSSDFYYNFTSYSDGRLSFYKPAKKGFTEIFLKGGVDNWSFYSNIFFHNYSWMPLALEPKPSVRKKGCWFPINGAIYFYDKTKPYYEFANFPDQCPWPYVTKGQDSGYDSVVVKLKGKPQLNLNDPALDNKNWKTTEHYFQAQKFVDQNTKEPIYVAAIFPATGNVSPYNLILNENTPSGVFAIGQKYGKYKRADWIKSAANTAMMSALRVKFSDKNQNLKNLLLSTGDRILVEDAGVKDAYWGAGADYMGENKLGQMLMIRRAELRGQRQKKPFVSKDPLYYINKEYIEELPLLDLVYDLGALASVV